VGAPLVGAMLFTHPTAVRITPAASPSPTQATPSPSPVPTARQLNLRAILIKPTDLRTGYVSGPFDSNPLCPLCVPASYSLFVTLRNSKLNRSITTASSVAPSVADSKAVVQELMKTWSLTQWKVGKGLGDESHTYTATQNGLAKFHVVWRSGVITNEIVLVAPKGSRTIQDALALAQLQQTRTVAADA
jgi:hypothetical protein